jgi:hypothetical protein
MRGVFAALLALSALCGVTARAEDRYVLIGAGGVFDLAMPNEARDRAPAYAFELRLAPGLWHFHPHLGFQGTTDGMVYGHTGIHLDLPLGENLRVVPSGSIGLYDQGSNEKDLGGLMEFRVGAGLAWRFANGLRIGASWYHMSNAYTANSNPGAEMLFLEIGYPLSKWW